MRAEQIVVRQCHRSRGNRRGVLLLRCGADRGAPVPQIMGVSQWEVPQTLFIARVVVLQCARRNGLSAGLGDEGVGAHHTGDELN